MKKNPIYESLLKKSIGSMLAAIEIYNKPNFKYREDTFAILSVNAWELLLKAYLFRLNKYNKKSIYELESIKKKDGSIGKHKQIAKNRCGNPKSISIIRAIELLYKNNKITSKLKANIDTLIEYRDNSIHFFNTDPITKQIQELGFACIKNYIAFIKKWDIDINLSDYNFYLMPLAYIDGKKIVDATLTTETENYINLVKSKLVQVDTSDSDFDIAISIDIDFKKGNSFDAIGIKYDAEGIPINVSEEDIRQKFPLTHSDVTKRCRERYSDFLQNKIFYSFMQNIKSDNKLCNIRKLDPKSPKTITKSYYSTNIWKELDKHYTKK